jgi:hypothetical protein
VTLHGAACERVQGGDVSEIALVAGCQTILR